MVELDMGDPCWPYHLAEMFLTAATCCEFTCDRMFVADGTQVEAPPPGCGCQLAALVDVGWRPPREGWAKCFPRKRVVVTLVLDLCVVTADADSIPAVDDLNASAQETITARWRILQGLQQARIEQKLGCECDSITPAGWIAMGTTGGMARWHSSWEYVTE